MIDIVVLPICMCTLSLSEMHIRLSVMQYSWSTAAVWCLKLRNIYQWHYLVLSSHPAFPFSRCRANYLITYSVGTVLRSHNFSIIRYFCSSFSENLYRPLLLSESNQTIHSLAVNCCSLPLNALLRKDVREKYDIKGSIWGDLFIHCLPCTNSCAMCQESREVKGRSGWTWWSTIIIFWPFYVL